MKRAIDVQDLSDAEYLSLNDAIQSYRSVAVNQFFHTVPFRDELGRLCQVRFFKDSESKRCIAVALIDENGQSQVVAPPPSGLEE